MREYILAVAVALLALAIYWYYVSNRPVEFPVSGDWDVIYLIPSEKNIILRGHYPFVSSQEIVATVEYPTVVFEAKGHRVILQLIEGNVCITNLGELNKVVRTDVNSCLAASGFVIDFAEGEDALVIDRNVAYVRGTPEDLPKVMRYLVVLVYPDAPEVYARAVAEAKTKG